MSGRHRRRHYLPRRPGFTACGLMPDFRYPPLRTTPIALEVTCQLCLRSYVWGEAVER